MRYTTTIDGKTYAFEGPEGVPTDEVEQEALAQYKEDMQKRAGEQSSLRSTLESAGIGTEKIVQGAGQLVGKIPGLSSVAPTDLDVQALRERGEIMKRASPTGELGEMIGGSAPLMMIPGAPLTGALQKAKMLPNALKWANRAMLGATDAGLTGAVSGALAPVIESDLDESRLANMGKAAGFSAVAGGAAPVVGRAGRGIYEHTVGGPARAERLLKEIADESPVDVTAPRMLPMSTAAKSGNQSLRQAESFSRDRRKAAWELADKRLHATGNRLLDEATAGRADLTDANKANEKLWGEMTANLKSRAPASLDYAKGVMAMDLEEKIPNLYPNREAKTLLSRTLSDDPLDALNVESMIAARRDVSNPELVPLRNTLDDALDRISGGEWKGKFMGPKNVAGQAQQRIKEAKNLQGIYDELEGGSASPTQQTQGEDTILKRAKLARTTQKYGADEYGEAIPKQSADKLKQLQEEYALVENARNLPPDKTDSGNMLVAMLRSAAPFRARPLAAQIGRSRSDSFDDRLADMLIDPVAFQKGTDLSRRNADKWIGRQNMTVNLLRSLASSPTMMEGN